MKKKILSLLLAMFMVIPMSLSLVACGDKETLATNEATRQSTMASENIILEYESTVYDGTEKKPSVTVKYNNEVIDSENYTVEYANNINAGEATVTVKSKSGSELLEENLTMTKKFVIEKKIVSVSTLSQLNAAIELTNENQIIVLADDIDMETDSAGQANPVLIFPKDRDYNVEIDLAGYDINSYIRIVSDIIVNNQTVSTDKKANVKIYNSSLNESVVGASDDKVDYAVVMKINNKFNIELENITFKAYWGGIYSNGLYKGDTKLTAKDCSFIGTKLGADNINDTSVGAYLASGKIVYKFVDCDFVGFGGYYVKSGHHVLINCNVRATADKLFPVTHYGDGAFVTGSAIMIDSCEGYNTVPAMGYPMPLTVDIIGGSYISEVNYGLQEFSTYKNVANKRCYAFIHVSDDAVLNGRVGKYSIENLGCAIGLR